MVNTFSIRFYLHIDNYIACSCYIWNINFSESFSAPLDHVTMMQIDCEVTDTQILRLQESVIPKHLRGSRKSSTNPSPKNRANVPAETPTNYDSNFVKHNKTNNFPSRNYNGTYALKSKEPYQANRVPYILKDRFPPEFSPETEKYEAYGTKNRQYLKPEVFIPNTDGIDILSTRGKKFRRKRTPASR